jgi:hypothetical protein
MGGRGRLQDDSTEGGRTQSFPCIIRCETVRFRPQKCRNGGQLWVVNVFSYTIHAQTDCWQSRSPLALSILFPLLLWRFLSSQLFCDHYTIGLWCPVQFQISWLVGCNADYWPNRLHTLRSSDGVQPTSSLTITLPSCGTTGFRGNLCLPGISKSRYGTYLTAGKTTSGFPISVTLQSTSNSLNNTACTCDCSNLHMPTARLYDHTWGTRAFLILVHFTSECATKCHGFRKAPELNI